MKNTPLEIDKYGSPKSGALKKAHLAKKLWLWNFKIEFFPLQSDKTITFLCLIVGVQVPLTQQWFGTQYFRSSHWRCSIKKLFLEILQYSQKKTCAGITFLIEFRAEGLTWDIFKNTYFEEHLLLLVLQKTNSNNICKLAV